MNPPLPPLLPKKTTTPPLTKKNKKRCTKYKIKNVYWPIATRGGSRAAATSKMERFVIIIKGFQPLTIITKCSIFDVAVAVDPPLATKMTTSIQFPTKDVLTPHQYKRTLWAHLTSILPQMSQRSAGFE